MNLDRFYSNMMATIQHSKLWKSAIMDQFVTFRVRAYTALLYKSNCKRFLLADFRKSNV